MDRRQFMGLTLAALAMAGDLEEVLWTPKKTIFVPPVTELVTANIELSRRFGQLHNGLAGGGNEGDFLTTMPAWQLRLHYPDVARMIDEHKAFWKRWKGAHDED